MFERMDPESFQKLKEQLEKHFITKEEFSRKWDEEREIQRLK